MFENSLGNIPYWDEKEMSLGVHVCKNQANSEFFCVRDKLNPVLMTKCPTQLEYGAIDVVKPENLIVVDLYKANEILCTIIELGQGKSRRMAPLGKTKSENYPKGLAWEFVSKAD